MLREVLREGRAGAKLPFVSFSLYCPKDNIEEALLLLLISESMVSSRAGPCLCGWGFSTQALAPRSQLSSASADIPETGFSDLLLHAGVRLTY